MLVKTFSYSSGGGNGACLDYLADGKQEGVKAVAEFDEDGNRLVTREGASLLSGDLNLTQELINRAGEKFKHGYTAGVLSFEEENIPMAEKMALMESWEECILPGIDREDFNIAWIEHTDKGRLELNWVIPRIHLGTEAHLQPYFHQVDKHRTKHWQEMTNAKYGYSSPDEPEKKHAITFNQREPQSKKDIRNAIDNLMMTANPQSREEVIDLLNDIEGLEVARQVKQSISVKVEGHERNIRLTGAYFEQDFRADNRQGERIIREQGKFESSNDDRYRKHEAGYKRGLAIATDKNRKKYERISRANSKHLSKQVGESRENAYGDMDSHTFTPSSGGYQRGDELGVSGASEQNGKDPKGVNQNGEFSVLGERETGRKIQERATKTSEKITRIFDEHRTDDKTISRGNEERNRTYAEYAQITTRVNRKSAEGNRATAEINRSYRRRARSTGEIIRAYYGGLADNLKKIKAKIAFRLRAKNRATDKKQTKSRGISR